MEFLPIFLMVLRHQLAASAALVTHGAVIFLGFMASIAGAMLRPL
jgi:hypothetical protein